MGWRADRSTLAGLLVTFFLISACCAHAQAKLDEVRDLARAEIARLEQTWRADRQALTFKDLNVSAPGLWASGDEAVLLRFQDLWISMAIRDPECEPRDRRATAGVFVDACARGCG